MNLPENPETIQDIIRNIIREELAAALKTAPAPKELPLWLSLTKAAEEADLSTDTFPTYAKANRIRTKPFGKRTRYHRDDVKGIPR